MSYSVADIGEEWVLQQATRRCRRYIEAGARGREALAKPLIVNCWGSLGFDKLQIRREARKRSLRRRKLRATNVESSGSVVVGSQAVSSHRHTT